MYIDDLINIEKIKNKVNSSLYNLYNNYTKIMVIELIIFYQYLRQHDFVYFYKEIL